MTEQGIHNAVISSVSLDDGERGLLTAWVNLDYGGTGQGFGGYALYLPRGYLKRAVSPNFAGHFIYRVLQVAGVSAWDKVPGKTVRVRVVDYRAVAIGHIVKEDWFDPSSDFAVMQNGAFPS